MKVSVSIPDELWSDVAVPDQSPSQVVQDALRALVAFRRDSEARVAESEARLESRDGPAGEEAGSGWTSALLEKLTLGALDLYDTGYRMAVEIAGKVQWLTLEMLPVGPRLRDSLLQWAAGDDTVLTIGGLVYQSLSDWEVGLDEDREPVPSQMLYEGMAAGLDDVRAAVRERSRRSTETARRA